MSDWLPAAVGVPEMAPVDESSARPAGKLPEPMVKVRSLDTNPEVVTLEENDCPTVALVTLGVPTLAPP